MIIFQTDHHGRPTTMVASFMPHVKPAIVTAAMKAMPVDTEGDGYVIFHPAACAFSYDGEDWMTPDDLAKAVEACSTLITPPPTPPALPPPTEPALA